MRLGATIDLENKGLLYNGSINVEKNNISVDLQQIVNKTPPFSSTMPFIIGASEIGGNSVLSPKVNYYVSKSLCNEKGIFPQNNDIKITGFYISNITICFDDVNGGYPKYISCMATSVSGKVEKVDIRPTNAMCNLQFSISGINKLDLSFVDWTLPNSPVIIKGIYIYKKVSLTNYNITDINTSIRDRSEGVLPSFGLVSNSAEISFIDFDGQIKFLLENKTLVRGLDVSIYIENEAKNYNEYISSYKIEDLTYDDNSREATLNLQDDLVDMQNIDVPYFSMSDNETSMLEIYEHLKSVTINAKASWSFEELDSATKTLLSKIKCQYPFIEVSKLWGQWQKLCDICGLHMYKYKGKIVTRCEYAD